MPHGWSARNMQVGFIGLGVMGFPMAGHVVRAGHEVRAYNRTPDRRHAWAQTHNGTVVASPREAASGAEVVLLCVGADKDVREVVAGKAGVLSTIAPGGILVDHTTTSSELARDMQHACQARGCEFIDAPMSGGEAGAVNAKLTLMVGGDEAALARVRPVLECYAASITRMGESGSGQLAKAVNQICIAGILQGLAEGLLLGQRAGLDVETLVAAISKGAAGSWQMVNRAATMAKGEFDFGFAVEHMRKDLKIALATAEDIGAPLPLTALVDQFYADVEALGGRRYDTSSLIERLRRLRP
ncbi:MAG: NAD(P)-dependent oxidoreductase [Gammaproteobacteria bacterium]|nr:NAD(P)-dependent oxidoreductase [Gammaproteobacteria bacterium]MCY4323711.1 NAD(P)-dependent oxidoreductase [Gammaproteobacteria bacterium]